MKPAALAALAVACLAAQTTVPLFQPGKARVLVLSGRNNHDWRTTTPFLRDTLLRTGRFDVRVEEEPEGITARTLAAYDLLVLDYNGPRWGEDAEKAIESFVRSGKGLVAVHGASYAFGGLVVLGDRHVRTGIIEPPWPAYTAMVGGAWSESAPKTGHAPRHTYTVKLTDREHPITQGMSESFIVNDELYHSIRTQADIHVLGTAFDDPKIGGTGKDEPLLWTVAYGSGRVFHTALGHDVAAMQAPGFVATFARGAEWAANGQVTLAADAGLPKTRKDAVRVQVVTGGHEYDPTFGSLFEGYDDIAATLRPHPDAYKGDLRKRIDVLVLYDLVQQVPEDQRKNLAAFVESGKGLVVLHHAIADFEDWPWWWREVVGGRYLLQAEGGAPASTYLHGQDCDVQPVAKHPVVAGIGPFRINDETYKKMWISPDSQILLRTDHPTSDGPLAWISPYRKSRVVYIQLGHGREAHLHPAYRQLVHNAILWAGKPGDRRNVPPSGGR